MPRSRPDSPARTLEGTQSNSSSTSHSTGTAIRTSFVCSLGSGSPSSLWRMELNNISARAQRAQSSREMLDRTAGLTPLAGWSSQYVGANPWPTFGTGGCWPSGWTRPPTWLHLFRMRAPTDGLPLYVLWGGGVCFRSRKASWGAGHKGRQRRRRQWPKHCWEILGGMPERLQQGGSEKSHRGRKCVVEGRRLGAKSSWISQQSEAEEVWGTLPEGKGRRIERAQPPTRAILERLCGQGRAQSS